MYGIRGINGIVEFVQVPVGDSLSTITIKLHELGVNPTRTMSASLDPETKKIRWKMDGQMLDGPAIVSMCQKFFIDFIEQTNAEDTDK